MELPKFKEILLKVAVCAIACDGDIDDREIRALHEIEKNSPYFSALDLSEILQKSLDTCTKDLNLFKKSVFDILIANTLNIVQELTVLEISLRIIAADEIEEDSERAFINDLRVHLELDDFLIEQRFGDIPYLKPKKSEFKSNKSDDLGSITQSSK
jgi:tellurite resistance protein